jgi:hypothetical protein
LQEINSEKKNEQNSSLACLQREMGSNVLVKTSFSTICCIWIIYINDPFQEKYPHLQKQIPPFPE